MVGEEGGGARRGRRGAGGAVASRGGVERGARDWARLGGRRGGSRGEEPGQPAGRGGAPRPQRGGAAVPYDHSTGSATTPEQRLCMTTAGRRGRCHHEDLAACVARRLQLPRQRPARMIEKQLILHHSYLRSYGYSGPSKKRSVRHRVDEFPVSQCDVSISVPRGATLLVTTSIWRHKEALVQAQARNVVASHIGTQARLRSPHSDALPAVRNRKQPSEDLYILLDET